MSEIPDASVHTVITSVPYWGLRKYPGGEGTIGLEETVDEWLDNLRAVFKEVWRVLRNDGTLWLNVGDAYAANNAVVRPRNTINAPPPVPSERMHRMRGNEFKAKDLIGLPWLLAFALRADGWYLRQDIIWAKPSPMPSPVVDRCTSSHEYVFLMAKARRYFFDTGAIREPLSESTLRRVSQAAYETQAGSDRPETKGNGPMKAVVRGGEFGRNRAGGDNQQYSGKPHLVGTGRTSRMFKARDARHEDQPDRWEQRKAAGAPLRHGLDGVQESNVMGNVSGDDFGDPLGANKRDVWTIASSGFPGAHFATFPEELVQVCLKAGSSEKGCCAECGAPYVRQTSTTYDNPGNRTTNGDRSTENRAFTPGFEKRLESITETIGWEPTCKHEAAIVPCLILDPFMGSGTVAKVALEFGRDYCGFEIAENYHRLIEDRLGLFHHGVQNGHLGTDD